MQPFTTLDTIAAPLPIANLDTDQIIPKQFLSTVERTGLARGLFYDLRFDEEGKLKPDFVLHRPHYAGAGVLVTGPNFGCGSSREHAPWALQGYGFKAVISPYFADIFRNNSLKVGLLPVQVDEETYEQLVSLFDEDPSTSVTVDLANQTVTLPDGRLVNFPIEPFAKHCLLNGVDQMGFLLGEGAAIDAHEQSHPQAVRTI